MATNHSLYSDDNSIIGELPAQDLYDVLGAHAPGTLRYSPYPLSHILDRLAQAFATDSIFRSRTA
ncbi:MAG: hypothetical protein GDA48_09415 [Hormoscilla sp. GM102CHS1]|nr:hypothetical protein [Hormoscilla sp. GM102CHS1]